MFGKDSKLENTIFANHLESGPYERVFLAPGQEGCVPWRSFIAIANPTLG